VVVRLVLIGGVVLLLALVFATVAGWFSPHRLTEQRMIEALAVSGGEHTGFRRNHAKGVCVSGWFDSNGQAASLSHAEVFAAGTSAVTGRFSLAGGMPFQPDKPGAVRALALQIRDRQGADWRTAMINLPVFPARTPRVFYELLLATAPDPATGKPDPALVHAFVAAHPESGAALGLIGHRTVSSGLQDATYNGLDAFRLVDANGHATPVRWSFEPEQPPALPASSGDNQNYLFDGLLRAIGRQPLRWHLVLTVGQPGDPTDDATRPWPAGRQRVEAGTLTLDQASSDKDGPCAYINFDPLVLPPGIEPSADPILSARSAVYARSFRLRAQEHDERPPSAITAQDVRQRER